MLLVGGCIMYNNEERARAKCMRWKAELFCHILIQNHRLVSFSFLFFDFCDIFAHLSFSEFSVMCLYIYICMFAVVATATTFNVTLLFFLLSLQLLFRRKFPLLSDSLVRFSYFKREKIFTIAEHSKAMHRLLFPISL